MLRLALESGHVGSDSQTKAAAGTAQGSASGQRETIPQTFPLERLRRAITQTSASSSMKEKGRTGADLPYSLLGVPSRSVASEGRSRGSSFRSLSEVAALSSARSSAALMSLRRESSGLLSCPVIIGSWRELLAQGY
ncbi:hypothetical protein EYF80_023934 [Liparis tanakae]|uniref:Uncharacterized protein n=1 Tax=Liparis tanakae TaxID=230148 RepID=A0A4Z2HLW5_9TELE|nr:hypothetical protein EYF80_023934 [Liparis tanakae]